MLRALLILYTYNYSIVPPVSFCRSPCLFVISMTPIVVFGIHDNRNTQYIVLWVTTFEKVRKAMKSSKSAAQVLKVPFEQLPNLPKPVIPDVNLDINNVQLTPSLYV